MHIFCTTIISKNNQGKRRCMYVKTSFIRRLQIYNKKSREMPTKQTNTLEDHDDDDSDDELLEMHNYHVDFLSPLVPNSSSVVLLMMPPSSTYMKHLP